MRRYKYVCVKFCYFAVSLFFPFFSFFFNIPFSLLLQESLEERVQELEQALLAERIAAQRDRATITKLQRQINKVSCYTKYFRTDKFVRVKSENEGRKDSVAKIFACHIDQRLRFRKTNIISNVESIDDSQYIQICRFCRGKHYM